MSGEIIAIIFLGITLIIIILLLIFRRPQDNTQSFSLLQQRIGQVEEQVKKSLDEGNKTVSEKFENSLEVIGDIKKTIGSLEETNKQMLEIGKDIAGIQDLLRPPQIRGGLGEMTLRNILSELLPRQNFEEQIWHRIGAESRAAWLNPTLHPELTSGANAFYASLRDYGRLALLFLNQGSHDSSNLVSSAWLKLMHTDRVDVGSYPSNFKRYGYQTWVRTQGDDSWYAGLGNHGQRFYIDPGSKSAMVIFALDESHIGASDKFWDQFRR